jgi:hypothetical protein
MRDEKSQDDTATQSYREEQGQDATDKNASGAPTPSVGAWIRGPVGREATPNDESASPGADADRDAAS